MTTKMAAAGLAVAERAAVGSVAVGLAVAERAVVGSVAADLGREAAAAARGATRAASEAVLSESMRLTPSMSSC